MEAITVIGTDTGVGKTLVSGGILQIIHELTPVFYWKPVQTGTKEDDDTDYLRETTGLGCFLTPEYCFPDPLSPHLAAKKVGAEIELDKLIGAFQKHKKEGFLVVEAAGGLMVPLNRDSLQIDFIKGINTPVLLVIEDRLGAINHSLLTLRACREKGIRVLGVVFTRASGAYGNAVSISQYGDIEILAEIATKENPREVISDVRSQRKLRELFKSLLKGE